MDNGYSAMAYHRGCSFVGTCFGSCRGISGQMGIKDKTAGCYSGVKVCVE